MTYSESLNILYNLPVYQHIGVGAYKPGLETTLKINQAFGSPSHTFPSIHIAGTNGKGSTAHTLASILQEAGYKVGLYTSPHIFDFRERIRVNGDKISEQAVQNFVEKYEAQKHSLPQPSFFELTTILAFDHFAKEKVDVAVIETGLGGRLDSTNILSPILSIITNISLDHMALLGNTLEKIAAEKAGIIKPGIPVVIGEADHPGVKKVFEDKAHASGSEITFAKPVKWEKTLSGINYGDFEGELSGECQPKNTATILASVPFIRKHFSKVNKEAVARGFGRVYENTHLIGRWTTVSTSPRVIIDTGHNIGAWQYTAAQLSKEKSPQRRLVMGFVADKDLTHILDLIAQIPSLTVYITQPSAPRALSAKDLQAQALKHHVSGNVYPNVNQALEAALKDASKEDVILVAGSNFLISDLELPSEFKN